MNGAEPRLTFAEGSIRPEGALTRMLVLLEEPGSRGRVVEEVARVASRRRVHVRFVECLDESTRWRRNPGFGGDVEAEHARMCSFVAECIPCLESVADVVSIDFEARGFGRTFGSLVDEPAGCTPQLFAAKIVEPFAPDIIVCAADCRPKLVKMLKGSMADYLCKHYSGRVVLA